MRLTPAQADLVEHMAKEQLRYETIFGEQSEVLRAADPPKFEAAMTRIQQSSLVAKYGQQWGPTQDNVDEYLTKCNDLCQLVPRDFDDRIKILHGAHAGLMCILMCKIAQEPECVQSGILQRHHELALSAYFASPTISNSQSLTKPAVEPRRIIPEELQFFQNPDNLHGKQFVFSSGTDDSGMYEVIGYHRARDKALTFDVLFDDCDDPITVGEKEMIDMLHDSLYLPV